jgi:hypothetical protein
MTRREDINLLDLVMPNGKKLRDCTGEEVAELGAFFNKLGHAVGDENKVKEALKEEAFGSLK